jgi:hypothetical protein
MKVTNIEFLDVSKPCSDTVRYTVNTLITEARGPFYEAKALPLSTSPSVCSNFKFEYSQPNGLVGAFVTLVPYGISDSNLTGTAGVST